MKCTDSQQVVAGVSLTCPGASRSIQSNEGLFDARGVPMSSKQLKFFAGGAVVVAAMAVLMAVSFQGNMAYYIEVSDYLSTPPNGSQRNTRIRGTVVDGSIVKTPGELGAAFEMTDGTDTMKVRYHKELPDTFVNQAEVVVEGEMGADRVFEAHTLLAKCPSKYEAEIDDQAGEPA